MAGIKTNVQLRMKKYNRRALFNNFLGYSIKSTCVDSKYTVKLMNAHVAVIMKSYERV